MKLFIDTFTHRRFGRVVFGVSEKGLRFLTFGKNASTDDVADYALKHKLEPVKSKSKTRNVKNQLRQYLDGKRKKFQIKFDIDYLTPFSRQILRAAYNIPYGQTLTYGELAKKVGSTAYRAVGRVMATNPIPIIIPCHRVIGRSGKLTGYAFGLDVKRRLLELEKAKIE
jgi:methylated-DNA-[protein]-cysteine S-methyltransferase